MIALDCGAFDSALGSCAAVLNMEPAKLLERLKSFEFDELSTREKKTYSYEDLLQMHVLGIAPGPDALPTPPAIHWFHATRVTAGTTFQEGILPLRPMLPRIWNFLGQLASEWSSPGEWVYFQQNMPGRGAQQYGWKVHSSEDQGPFGFLVRFVIFESDDMGNHDYLGMPEIVEDVCLSYEEQYKHPLRASYLRATRPCIVKFRSHEPRSDAVGVALMYLHRTSRGEDLWTPCNTSYDGGGVAVDHTAILGIEWPADTESPG